MQTNTVKQSLKAEVLKILSINQTADSFVNVNQKITEWVFVIQAVLYTLKLREESRLKTFHMSDS